MNREELIQAAFEEGYYTGYREAVEQLVAFTGQVVHETNPKAAFEESLAGKILSAPAPPPEVTHG